MQAARGEALGATVALYHPERQGSPHCNRRATSNIIEGNAISFSVIKPSTEAGAGAGVRETSLMMRKAAVAAAVMAVGANAFVATGPFTGTSPALRAAVRPQRAGLCTVNMGACDCIIFFKEQTGVCVPCTVLCPRTTRAAVQGSRRCARVGSLVLGCVECALVW